jgi:hypothetical protein
MAFALKIDLRGDREVKAALDGVKEGVKNRVVKAAAAKQARKAARSAKQLAPRGPSGRLKASEGTKFKSYRDRAVWVYVVGARFGFAKVVNGRKYDPVYYAHLVEGGRRNTVRPKKGKALKLHSLGGLVRGKASPYPGSRFMERSWRSLSGSGLSEMKADILAGVAREAAKYASKGKTIYRR